MICDSCKIDQLVNNFLNNNNICYKCVYREKTKKIKKLRIKKPTLCRKCGSEVVKIKNAGKRQRTTYCSETCAKSAHKEIIKNYWIRHVNYKSGK